MFITRLLIILCSLIFSSILSFGQDISSTKKIPELVIKGKGKKTLLLIPCMSCRWNQWEEFMDRNSSKYKMYAVTLPGHGGTPTPNLPKNTEKTPWRDNVIQGLSELINQYKLKELIVVAHSWGTMPAVQLTALRKDAIKKLIAIDGAIESTTWTPSTKEERLKAADSVIKTWKPKFENAEEWSKFNGVSLGNIFNYERNVPKEVLLRKLKINSSFMATDKNVVLQYWRENSLIDLTSFLHKISIPILDIQAFTGKEQEKQKEKHLAELKTAKTPSNVKNVFMYDTRHHVMYHRPLELDKLINNFISGKAVKDFSPNKNR